MPLFRSLLRLALLLIALPLCAAETARQTIVRAILSDDEVQRREIIGSLAGQADEAIEPLFTAWKEDALFVYAPEGGAKVAVQLIGEKDAAEAQAAIRIDSGQPLKDAAGKEMRLVGSDLTAVEHDATLRRAMKAVVDLQDLSTPNLTKRVRAIQTMGQAQAADKLPALRSRLELEHDSKAQFALREAIALIGLKDSSDVVKLTSLKELNDLRTIGSLDFIKTVQKEAEAGNKTELVTAARSAAQAVENHISLVNFFGTIFRGVSLGSVLLVVALGLAITFGLMGVINMAHGEMIAVGAYTTYVVQGIFSEGVNGMIPFTRIGVHVPGLGLSGWGYQCYFLVAIPLSFLMAALVGVGLERSVIRFLYRRPLESLLATWGVSLVLQQIFKLTFGANNVQVSSPIYLSGNWTFHDIIFGWNRVFVIGFAVLIVFGTWCVLTKTPLGLLIRSVMQNRTMASCMGVRTERVNMLTFGLGSGLAGLAGAFLSQIGNVGPTMGQNYIVDCFMTVVVGGVGNLAGTVISALGIGLADQSLQQLLLNPVIGKILVLVAIILFLQWRPAGIFVTRSRSLD